MRQSLHAVSFRTRGVEAEDQKVIKKSLEALGAKPDQDDSLKTADTADDEEGEDTKPAVKGAKIDADDERIDSKNAKKKSVKSKAKKTTVKEKESAEVDEEEDPKGAEEEDEDKDSSKLDKISG